MTTGHKIIYIYSLNILNRTFKSKQKVIRIVYCQDLLVGGLVIHIKCQIIGENKYWKGAIRKVRRLHRPHTATAMWQSQWFSWLAGNQENNYYPVS